MHRRLPTEKIHLSPQFYQHIFTSLRPQMWKVSCMPGLREKFLAWPTTNHSDDPLEVLGSSWQQWWLTSACSQSSLQTCGNKLLLSVFIFFLHWQLSFMVFIQFFFFWAEIKTSDSWHCHDKSVQEALYWLPGREMLWAWFTVESKSSSAVTPQYRKMLAINAVH